MNTPLPLPVPIPTRASAPAVETRVRQAEEEACHARLMLKLTIADVIRFADMTLQRLEVEGATGEEPATVDLSLLKRLEDCATAVPLKVREWRHREEVAAILKVVAEDQEAR